MANGIEPQRKKDATDLIIPIIIALVVAFFAMHISCAYTESKANTQERIANGTAERIEIANGFSYSEMANIFSQRMKTPLKNIYYNNSMILFILCGELCLGLYGLYAKLNKKKLITGKEYGTAEWATKTELNELKSSTLYRSKLESIDKNKELEEIEKKEAKAKLKARYVEFSKKDYKSELKKAKTKDEKNAIKKEWDTFQKYFVWYKTDRILTKTEKICMINFDLNNHTLIIGGSGAGKSRGYVLPNLLQANTSNIVTDPKGELYGKVGYFLTKIKGYKVRLLELGNYPEKSDCFNPLYYIHRDRTGWETRVLSIIKALIANSDDGGYKQKANDPFWERAEELFLQAIILAVVEAFPQEEVNFNTVNQLVSWLKIEEDGDLNNSLLDCFFEEFANTYGENHIAVQHFHEFRTKAAGKTAKCITMCAVVRLGPIKTPDIQRILDHDDMRLDMVGEELTTIFVVKPPTIHAFDFIAGMLFTLLFDELNYCATIKHIKQQRVPVPVHFYLDEFYNTCRIPHFVEIQSYARSLGVGTTVILQSLDQLKDIYEKEWGTIIDNSDTFLFLGNIKSMETLEYVSKLLGKGTFDKKTTSRTKGKSGSSSTTFDKIGRELMTPDEIRKMPKKKCLLFVSGKSPFKSDKYDYTMHPYYKYTSDYDEKYFYEHTPQYIVDQAQEREQKEKLNLRKQVTANIEREIDRLINENKLIFRADDEKTIQLLNDYRNVEFVDGYFPNSEEVNEETTEGMTSQEVRELLQYTANKKEIELEIQVESFFANELLQTSATTEQIAETISNLNDNRENVVDVGAENSISQNEDTEEITENVDEDGYETVSDEDQDELVLNSTSLIGRNLAEEIISLQEDEVS